MRELWGGWGESSREREKKKVELHKSERKS